MGSGLGQEQTLPASWVCDNCGRLFVCAWMCLCMYAHGICVRSQGLMLDVFLYYSPLYF